MEYIFDHNLIVHIQIFLPNQIDDQILQQK